MSAPSAKFTEAEIADIVDTATSYSDAERKLMLKYEGKLTDEELSEILLDNSVELCPTCQFYVESHERVNPETDEPDDCCDNCR